MDPYAGRASPNPSDLTLADMPTLPSPDRPKRKIWGRLKRPFGRGRVSHPDTNTSDEKPKQDERSAKERVVSAAKATPRFVFELVFGGSRFCCCIPTRFGVVVGSCVQFLVALALAIILWFEVTSAYPFIHTNLKKLRRLMMHMSTLR